MNEYPNKNATRAGGAGLGAHPDVLTDTSGGWPARFGDLTRGIAWTGQCLDYLSSDKVQTGPPPALFDGHARAESAAPETPFLPVGNCQNNCGHFVPKVSN
jgi:hypothetical protein